MDTPKGDLDKSGEITGPGKIVIPNNFVYPWGTTEQYPSGDEDNSAHEYRECSNKGKCRRDRGICQCYTGYEGSACQRATCPNDCSNRGTCQTIGEMAKKDHNNVYELWDADTTMGCVCDDGYTGPDCSERLCKVGQDPLYTRDSRTPRYSNFTYQIYSLDTGNTLSGYYNIVFFDAYGKHWVSGRIRTTDKCEQIVYTLEKLPNDVIPDNSVACYIENDVDANGQNAVSDPITDANMFVHEKVTLAFSKNPGKLKQLDITWYTDGKKPTLYTNEEAQTAQTLGYHVYANGFIGERVDMVPDRCDDVTVTLAAGTHTHYLDGLDRLEAKLLKRCLGDVDANNANNMENYNWDYGTLYNPHLIKLLDVTMETFTKVVDVEGNIDYVETYKNYPKTQLCNPTNIEETLGTDADGVGYCSSIKPASFYAVLIYDDADVNPFRIFTRPAEDYGTATEFAVFTTRGHLQLVTPHAAVFNVMSSYSNQQMIKGYYSKTLHITNTTGIHADYFGNMDCETQTVGENGLLDCLNKNDYVMFLSINASTEHIFADASSNPIYPNIYQIQRIHRAEKSYLNDPGPIIGTSIAGSEKVRLSMEVDYGVNHLMKYSAGWNVIVSDTSARVYKFYPDDSTLHGGYDYAIECSGRGVCDRSTGICDCFSGYTMDNCDTISGSFQ